MVSVVVVVVGVVVVVSISIGVVGSNIVVLICKFADRLLLSAFLFIFDVVV